MKDYKERVCSVDLFRYICAVLVIAIHTDPLQEINPELGFIAGNAIPRIGVPFFFIVSGYFYFQKIRQGEKPFWQYLRHLLVIYSLWSCLYFVIIFVKSGHRNIRRFFAKSIVNFIWHGSFYHFWFFPALIFALCFTTLLWKIKCRRLIIPLSLIMYIPGCLGCAYYNLVKTLPILGPLVTHPQFKTIRRIFMMGFPFFAGGYLVLKLREKISRKKIPYFLIIFLIIWIAELLLVVRLDFQDSIVTTFGLYPLVIFILIILLQNPLPHLRKPAAACRKIASFTYYSHPAIILLISYTYKTLLHKTLPNTALFLITAIFTFLLPWNWGRR